MRIARALVGLVIGIGYVCAQLTTRTTVGPTPASFSSVAATQTATGTGAACFQVRTIVASYIAANPKATRPASFPPSLALACLESIPLNVTLSLAFINYVKPFLQFQSTIEYLKNPPTGFLFPGVDIFKGIEQIQTNLANRAYKSQWDFEKDMFYLINVMPHDFHLVLGLPLVNSFQFRNLISLVSVSSDGVSLPQVYFLNDSMTSNTTSWKPSPLISIDGRPVADYLKNLGESSSNFQDPDGIYNLLFTSIPGTQQRRLGNFDTLANAFGLPDTTTYSFANGSSLTLPNFAYTTFSLGNITNGHDLFVLREVPTPSASGPSVTGSVQSTMVTSVGSSSGTPTVSPTPFSMPVSTTTQVPGYPTPVVLHSNGYTGGYFLPNSQVAVLVISAFTPLTIYPLAGDQEQQSVIKKFLAACKAAGKTNLIVDLSSNGGGAIFSAYDAFKQIFPTKVPFGGARFRASPELNYFGEVITAAGAYKDYETPFETHGQLDVNLHNFSSWDALYGPYQLDGANLTAETRYDLNDIPLTILNGITVTGYGNLTNVSDPVFSSNNIVMLQDGTCGSACSLFAEFMKSQGGVRSVVVGGRPQNSPMQGIGGSKGAQAFAYGNVQAILSSTIPDALMFLSRNNQTLPPLPAAEFIPSTNRYAPLGMNTITVGGINLRNQYRQGDLTNTPLQFTYEAGNCRLFFKVEDLLDYSALWKRVAAAAWGNGTCVPGSSIYANNTISGGAFDTVPFSSAVMSSVNYTMWPGSVAANMTNSTSTALMATSMVSSTSTSTSSSATSGAAGGVKQGSWLALLVVLAGLVTI